uniref:GTP_EFTU_D3 domain-containing protein n=1 Tax=Macrostomum lignano TaxID=282301 RepID=A0A1I8GLF5_9PLAT
VPFIVVITKIDLCDHGPVLASVEAWLKATGNKRVPLIVQTKDDAITAADNIFQAGGSVTPLGPGVDGVFVTVRITGLNRNRLPCGAVQAGHWASVTVCLQLEDRNWGSHSLPRVAESFARRGAFLIPLNSHPPAVLSFSAEVALHCRQRGGGGLSGGPLRHNQPVNILCGIVCQQAIVSNGLLASASASSGLNSSKRRQQQQRRIDCSVASPVQVHLRFAKQAELLRPGDRLVLRSGHRLLGVGRVLQTNNLLES